MTTVSDLTQHRTDAQRFREEIDRRERTLVDLRMVYTTLEDRLERVSRDADSERSDERIASHVDRLLDRHAAGRRPLGYLGETLTELDVEKRVHRRLERRDRPRLNDGDGSLGAFAEGVTEFLHRAADDDDDGEMRAVVRKRYRELLAESEPAALARAFAFVGVVLEAGRLALAGDRDSPVIGARTRLSLLLGDHVETLERTDGRLVEGEEPDPYVALDWSDPVAMLPIRLETRFRQDVLQIRAYPEQLHVDTHEEQLTEAERRWGESFWTQLWVAGVPSPTDLLTADGALVDPSLLPDDRSVAVAESLLAQFDAGEFSPEPGRRFDEVRERAWAQGAERFDEERASYVIDALSPVQADADDVAVGAALRKGWTDVDPPKAPLDGPVAVAFPDVDMRPESWTRAPQARLLPDRFVAHAYYDAADGESVSTDWELVEDGVYERRDGAEFVRRVTGPAVAEPLAVGPSPEAVATDGDPTDNMRWMTDFDEAVRVGMAFELPLPDPDTTPYSEADGFSRLVVTGAKTSMDATHSRQALGDLLDASQYTDGLELLPPGTPTNNADAPSGRSTRRTPGESVEDAAGPPLAKSGTDGQYLAKGLGVPPDVFSQVSGAGDTREAAARAMNRALWPATIGYYARNLLVPDTSGDREPPGMLGTGWNRSEEGPPVLLRWLETYRDHFVDHVRAGGPFQTVRVGAQPYGVLPVAPLDVRGADRVNTDLPEPAEPAPPDTDDFVPADIPRVPDDRFVPELVTRALSLRDRWLAAGDSAPSVATDPALSEDDLLSMLAMEATASLYRRQLWLLGDDNPLFDHAGLDDDHADVVENVRSVLQSANLPGTTPRIANLLFLGVSLTSEDLPVTDEDVATFLDTVVDLFAAHWPDFSLRVLGTDPDRSTFRLSTTARAEWPRDLVLELLDPSTDPGDYDPTASLLRQLVRFAALQAAVAARVRVGAMYGRNTNEWVEFPAEPTSYGPGEQTVFQLFDDALPLNPEITGAPPLSAHPSLDQTSDFRDFLRATGEATGTTTPPPDAALGEFLDALTFLTSVDPERLGRLTTETLDLASHRLDAWWTSLATRRLREHRAAVGNGVQVAAFGFVEDLSRRSGPDAEYLLAPSLDQATTASVLRSAHKARAGDDDPSAGALAIDCSAEQVRRARPLLDGVRNGLDLSVLLGYRLERGLREASGDSLNLEQYIDDFRTFAPAIEGKLGRDDTEDASKRSDVVDGRAVYRAWKDGRLWSAPELSLSDAEKRALGGESPTADEDGVLQEIDAAMDAVHDVLVAEGVHHLAHGRPERAAQALEALSRGKTPPNPTVVDTPRSETGVTHRLLLVFGDVDALTAASGWSETLRPVLIEKDLPSHDASSSTDGSTGDGGADGGNGGGGDALTMEPVQVRQDGEPALEAWAGDLLPKPSRIGCTAEFQWERDRGFAVGRFETPVESGTVSVDGVGFRPDVVLLTAAVGPAGDGATTAASTGWSHGAFRRDVGQYPAVQHATSASVTRDGTVSHATTTTAALLVALPTDAGTDRIEGEIVATTDQGFDLDVQLSGSDAPDRVTVQYRAYQLADPTSVRVGTLTTPAATDTPTTVDLTGDASVPGDTFAPDHVLFTAAIPGASDGDGPTALGISTGAVMRDADGSLTQQTLGFGLAPADDDSRVAARTDAVVEATPGSGAAVRLAVTGLPGDGTADLTASAPGGAAYAGTVPVTYVAIESPTIETPVGAVAQRPAMGAAVAPADPDDAVSVSTGFRPALVEVRFAAGVTGDGVDDLPVEATVTPADAGFSIGAATGRGVQGALATGLTADAGSVLSAPGAVGRIPTTGPDGPVDGASVSVTSFTDDGFSLAFDALDGDRPIVFYRAWPAEPTSQAFAVDVPGGIGLDDLDVTALDAVSLTQGVAAAGDSQLERRIGYYAFRHRPAHRPPIPGDATLDLSFTETGDAFDVSVAEYVEVARSLDDLVGDARPADAADLAHPGDVAADATGYLEKGAQGGGTTSRLEARANRIEERLAVTDAILTDRLDVLDHETNVCDRVERLEETLRAFRRVVPVPQVTEVTAGLERDHPGEHHLDVAGTVLEELRTVAEYVRAGPNDASGVDFVVTDEPARTIAGRADVAGPTELDVTAYSISDAVRFTPKTTRVTTDEDGVFEASFDFDGVPVGTDVTVVARRLDGGDGGGDAEFDAWIEAFLDRLDRAERLAVLVQLAGEDRADLGDAFAETDRFERLIEEVREEFAHDRRPLAVFRDIDDVVRRMLGRDRRRREPDIAWVDELDAEKVRELLDRGDESVKERFRDLVAALTGSLLLDRAFENPRPDDWTFVDEPPRTKRTSEWTFDPDARELRQTSNIYGFEGPEFEAPGTLAVVGDREWTDYRVTVRLTSDDDDAIGVLFRYQDEENFYRFSMDAERNYRRLVRKIDDEPELLWEDDAGFETGREYDVTVECVGTALTVLLDGKPLVSLADDGLDHGTVGVYCRANKAARFHGITVRVSGLSSPIHAGTRPVYAADCRVVDADDVGGWRDLPAVVAEQQYLPRLLWLARVLPDMDPTGDGVGDAFAAAVAAIQRDDLGGEHELMGRVLTIVQSETGDPQAFDADDLAAVADLLDLRPLNLEALASAVRTVVGPTAWTGLTDLVSLTGDVARPTDQRPWRAGNPSPSTLYEKDAEGEVRARLERLRSFPRTDAAATYAAYSPPIRAVLSSGVVDETFVETVEVTVAEPAAVVEAIADAAPGVLDLLTGLHDLLHHVDALGGADRVDELREATGAFRRAVERADSETVEELAALGVDAAALADGFATHGDTLRDAVHDYQTGPDGAAQIDSYLLRYARGLGTASTAATEELEERVLPAAANHDLTGAFRAGVLESLRRGLLRASYFGIYGSVPASAAGRTAADEETLVAQARRVGPEVADRLGESVARRPVSTPGDPTAAESTVDEQVDRLQVLLGDTFVVLPPFAPANPAELHGTLTDPDLLEDPYATDTWLQRVSRVRDLPASFQRVRTYADALALADGSADPLRRTLTVGQIPHVPGQSWLGQDGVTPGGGELSLGIAFANEYDGIGPLASTPGEGAPGIAGLLVDEWVERVPDTRETLGLGLQYDDPSTRAPQSLVLATPPSWRVDHEEGAGTFVTDVGPTLWTERLLQQSLSEVQDLIRMRAADLDALAEIGHLLPMLCFPDNRETVLDRGSALPDAPSIALDEFTWRLF